MYMTALYIVLEIHCLKLSHNILFFIHLYKAIFFLVDSHTITLQNITFCLTFPNQHLLFVYTRKSPGIRDFHFKNSVLNLHFFIVGIL